MRKNQFGKSGSISYIKDRKVYRVFAPVNKNNLSESGKPIRKSLGSYKTLEEAQKVLASYTVDPISYTFNEIIDLWLEDYLKTTTKENTKKLYKYTCDHIIKGLFTPLLEENIKNIHNKDISKVLQNSKYSYSSKCLIKTIINMIFNFALSNNWIENNYISLIRLPKDTNKPDKPSNIYTVEDIEKLFDAINNPDTPSKMIRYIKIMLVLLYTGLRKEELFKCAFDNYSNIIYVKESKTYNGQRIVPIHYKIINFIKDFNFDTHKPHILDGITSKQLNYNFEVINKYFGFGIHTVHNCRKSFITRLISKGANLPLVAKLVGHSTKSITVDIYTKPDIEDLRQVINLLN